MNQILASYGLTGECKLSPLGNGLINHTSLVECNGKKYVLQQINQQVFHKPEDIAGNIGLLKDYLQTQHPGYLFVAPLSTLAGDAFVIMEGQHYRLFPFIDGSHTLEVAAEPTQAWEAARQFGRFTRMLDGFDASRLRLTLPDFHNMPLRYDQFKQALRKGNPERINSTRDESAFLQSQYVIAGEWLQRMHQFSVRVTHHDTKISNVLFDENGKGLCVIDLDTVMPGYFISDVGDMMRTYLSPVSEEEADTDKIIIRREFYQAIVDGYGSEMNDLLNDTERSAFLFAGKFMIYMQALRFYTDYLNDDIYYGSRYEGHNLVRARNQVVLLQRLIEFGQTQL